MNLTMLQDPLTLALVVISVLCLAWTIFVLLVRLSLTKNYVQEMKKTRPRFRRLNLAALLVALGPSIVANLLLLLRLKTMGF